MSRIFKLAFVALAMLSVSLACAAPAAPHPPAKNQASIDFSAQVPAIELRDFLTPYRLPTGGNTGNSRWYTISATNGSGRPVGRVLVAADPPDAPLRIFPLPAHAQILQLASPNSGVAVETVQSLGRDAFQVTIPPASSVTLAVRVGSGDSAPSILAWSGPALVAYDRQRAIFLAAAAGLIAAALAIMAGVAAISSDPVPSWTALVLAPVFLLLLQGAGTFDSRWTTAIGGPYGLTALLAGLALVAGLRLADLVAPVSGLWPSARRWGKWLLFGLAGLSLLAFFGAPATALLTCACVVSGTVLAAAYLLQRGFTESKAARLIAPGAVLFAVAAGVEAAVALGAFRQSPPVSGAITGLVAAGAVLLALAVAAGEGAMLGGERNASRRCLGLIADVTVRKESEPSHSGPNLRDGVTGLGDRRELFDRLEEIDGEWAAVALAILEIDRFTAICAHFGSGSGERIMAGLGSRFVENFGEDSQAFRIGADRLALIFPAGAERASAIGAALVDIAGAPFAIDGRRAFVSASVGAAAGSSAEDPFKLIGNAEIALSLAKREGGGRSRMFAPEMEVLASGDTAAETDLRRGIARNEFVVHYQPVVRMKDGAVAGIEASLLWRHPQKGLLTPAEFIPHGEETGVVLALGRFVLERAISDLCDWQRHFPIEPPLFISLNVSRRQLRDERSVEWIGKLIAGGEFPSKTLKLEVTESAIGLDEEDRRVLERLHNAGASLVIGDFGAGLSTLHGLKDLPIDAVKIDCRFLIHGNGGENREEAAAAMSSIVTLARNLNREVAAKGVETERDAIWLRQLGCEFAQGRYFGPPLAAEDALKFIADRLRARPDEVWPDPANLSPASSAAGVG